MPATGRPDVSVRGPLPSPAFETGSAPTVCMDGLWGAPLKATVGRRGKAIDAARARRLRDARGKPRGRGLTEGRPSCESVGTGPQVRPWFAQSWSLASKNRRPEEGYEVLAAHGPPS